MKLSEYNISSLIQKVSSIEDSLLYGACYDIVKEMVKSGVSLATNYNSSAPKSGLEDNIIYSIDPKVTKKVVNGGVVMSGENAIYDEFGTGEQGLDNPHPMKEQFSLNPYNSGPTIFYNQFAGRHQWYYRPMAGKPYFTKSGATEGIPAGKQMYNTLQNLNKIKRNIAVNETNKVIGEINKVINKFK